jgi:hypothetical protein
VSWTPEEIEAKLRRITNTSTLEVRRDRAWALRNRHHPEALQVWDRGVRTGKPYFVAVLERRGVPCEPDERWFHAMWAMHADQVHRGRPGWADKIGFDARDYEDAKEAETWRRFDERMEAAKDPIMHMLGEGRTHKLDRTMLVRRTKR